MDEKRERLTLVEMERKLLNDVDGSYRRDLLNQLNTYQDFIKSRINSGLSPQQFSVFNKLKLALESAHKVITNFK
jgi:hypothetical protein